MADKPNFISLLLINNGSIGKIHDSSAIHLITPSTASDGSTWIITIGNPLSNQSTTTTLYLPAGVALKSDISAVMIYKGTISSSTDLPRSTKYDYDPSTGYVYVANNEFKYYDSSIERGDMFLYNGTTWDIIQTNIDPSAYAGRDHTHSVVIAGTTSEVKFTPSGTISVEVTGKSTTFTGEHTPAGTISTTYGFTSTNASVTNDLKIANHSHSFTGTAATISLTVAKAATVSGASGAEVSGNITASYTPAGSISSTVTTEATTISVTGTFADHSHTFNGSLTTFSGKFTPSGTISKPNISATVSTDSFDNITKVELTSSSVDATVGTAKKSVVSTLSATISDSNEMLYLNWGNADVVSSATASVKVPTSVKLTTQSITYANGVNAALSDAPTFTGIEGDVKVSGTPNGTTGNQGGSISGTTSYNKVTAVGSGFTGTQATITSSFNLTAANHTHSIGSSNVTVSTSYTPEGTIGGKDLSITGDITVSYSKVSSVGATFNGTKATVSVTGTPLLNAPTGTFYGAEISHSHSISGTASNVSKPVE